MSVITGSIGIKIWPTSATCVMVAESKAILDRDSSIALSLSSHHQTRYLDLNFV